MSQDRTSALSAILVNYNCDAGGDQITAFVYKTNHSFTGNIDDVLTFLDKEMATAHIEMTGTNPPKPIIINGIVKPFGFMTQAWQGETRNYSSGNLFYVKKEVA